MAIRVSCSKCGTVLDVPDQAAGKAVPCPACQMKVFVPAMAAGAPPNSPQAAAAPQQPGPRQPAPRQMPANQPVQGLRPTEMPSASPTAFQTYGVTPQGPPPLGAAPGYPAAGQGGPWTQTPQFGQPQFGQPQFGQPQFGQPAMPHRGPARSRGFFANPWVLTTITLLCLGGVALLVWWLFFSKGKADLAWMPDNPDIVAQVKVKDLLDSGFVRTMEQEFPEFSRDKWSELAQVPGGIDIAKIAESIDTVTVGARMNSGAFIARYDLNRDLDIAAMMQQAGRPAAEERQIAGHKVLVSDGMAWCEVSERVMIFGEAGLLEQVLNRGETPDISGRMEDALGETDFSKTIAMAMAAPSGEDTEGMKAVYAWAEVDDGLELSITLDCDSSQMAAMISQGASAVGPALKQFAGSGLEDYESDRSGNTVTITAEVNSNIISELKKNAGQFLGPGFNPEQLFQGL